MLGIHIFLFLAFVFIIAVLVSLRDWEWQVPSFIKDLMLRVLAKWREKIVTVQLFYSPGTITQIEGSLQNLKDDLAQMEKTWGVRFHVLVTLPENLAEDGRENTDVLERKFPEFIFLRGGET